MRTNQCIPCRLEMKSALYGWRSGESLTAEVLKADTTIRESAIALTETGTTGVYFGTPAAIVAGDTVIVDDGSNKVGFGEYQTGVNCELIEGANFTDTLIGADGDTLESISDQNDGLTSSVFKPTIRFGPKE